MSEQFKKEIETFIKSKPIAVFMKGTKDFPMCGFSARTIEALTAAGADPEKIASFNVLENRPLFEYLKQYSQWPTSPQVYIGEKFVGGCDIICEMFDSGELQSLVKAAAA